MQALNAFALVSALFLANTAVAAPQQLPYEVSAELDGDNVRIGFQTKKTYSSMCGRQTTELTIREPKSSGQIGIPTPALGLISFKTALKPHTMCMMAFGPHRGGITLALGNGMPAVAPGYYVLEIDGKKYGFLQVSEDGAELLDASQLPQ